MQSCMIFFSIVYAYSISGNISVLMFSEENLQFQLLAIRMLLRKLYSLHARYKRIFIRIFRLEEWRNLFGFKKKNKFHSVYHNDGRDSFQILAIE